MRPRRWACAGLELEQAVNAGVLGAEVVIGHVVCGGRSLFRGRTSAAVCEPEQRREGVTHLVQNRPRSTGVSSRAAAGDTGAPPTFQGRCRHGYHAASRWYSRFDGRVHRRRGRVTVHNSRLFAAQPITHNRGMKVKRDVRLFRRGGACGRGAASRGRSLPAGSPVPRPRGPRRPRRARTPRRSPPRTRRREHS